jgi:hypothetical protein
MSYRIILLNIDDSNYAGLQKILKAGIVSFADVPVSDVLLQAIEKELTGITSKHLLRRITYLENPVYARNQEILNLLSANFGVLEYASVSHSGELTLRIDGREYIGASAILKTIQNEIITRNHPSPLG